jgi:hypothetical protein
LLVAAAGVCCPTSVAEACFEWVKLTSTGWQLSFRATAPDPGGNLPVPDVVMGQAMSELSLTDDAGQSCDLRAEDVRWGRTRARQEQEWHGHAFSAAWSIRFHAPAVARSWVLDTPDRRLRHPQATPAATDRTAGLATCARCACSETLRPASLDVKTRER